MRGLKASLVAAAFLVAVPSSSGAVPESEAIPNDAEQMVQNYYTDFFGHNFADALSDIKDLSPDATNGKGQAVVAAMRASALLGLKRETEANLLIAEIDRLSPNDPTARSTLFQGALLTDHFDVAADSIDELIARFPDAARSIDWDLIRYLLAHEPKGQDRRNEDRRVALARIGYGGDSMIGHWRAANAVRILADRGDEKGAGELLQKIKEPQAFEDMLIQRRFSALWPRLEAIGGEHLAKLRAESLESAEKEYLASPDDMEKLQAYVDALRHSGRLDDAIALKSKLPQTSEGMAKADEKAGWVVNSIAYALMEAGRLDEGDRLFAMLNDPPRSDASWRVSMIINRLEMLVTNGRFQKASGLLDATEESAKNDGSPFARQLVRRLRYCILRSTGKKDEAGQILPDMLSHADDALEPTIEGLLCAGDTDKAEELALAGLKNPDKDKREQFEDQFVRALQPVHLTEDDPSVWDNRWAALRSRPQIAAAYARLGRDLPAELLPENKIHMATK